MNLQQITTLAQLQACFETLLVLRPHIKNQPHWIEQILQQQKEGYQSFAITQDNQVVAYMGLRFMTTLAWGKILYIDDLVSHPSYREKGFAQQLLSHAEKLALDNDCDQIHLDSGYQRQDAHRLYLNNKFNLTSHHFSKTLTKKT